jgi:hypothetical protein
VDVVQEAPARPYLRLVTELRCRRRATEPDESRVRPIAQIQERRVDEMKLPRLPQADFRRSVGCANAQE